MGCVYLITHRDSGKQYVGKTVEDFGRYIRRVFRQAFQGVRGRVLLNRAIRKHGFDRFSVTRIAQFNDPNTLCLAEQLFISELNTRAPYGYNATDGGEGAVGVIPWNKGKVGVYSEESLARFRGPRGCSPKMRAHIEELAARARGKKRPPFSDEWKRKISESKKGKCRAK